MARGSRRLKVALAASAGGGSSRGRFPGGGKDVSAKGVLALVLVGLAVIGVVATLRRLLRRQRRPSTGGSQQPSDPPPPRASGHPPRQLATHRPPAAESPPPTNGGGKTGNQRHRRATVSMQPAAETAQPRSRRETAA